MFSLQPATIPISSQLNHLLKIPPQKVYFRTAILKIHFLKLLPQIHQRKSSKLLIRVIRVSKPSVICLITFFQCICILLKTLVDNSFLLLKG